jgi:hypothetical protein
MLHYVDLFITHLFTCAYTVWVISQPSPLSPLPPHFQAKTVLRFSPVPLKRRHKHNKEDIAFLLVEIRIAIRRDS